MKLALAPIVYYWPREVVLGYYRDVADASVDIVYLGETVCSRRHELRLPDWLDVAAMLSAAGKEVILSTQILIESESDLKTSRRITSNDRYEVEANDMGAVRLLAGRPFVGGASLNIYNSETLSFLAALGLERWVAPAEMTGAVLAAVQRARPAGVQTEVFVYGRLPLAHSARCFTARRFNLQKDACEFRCLEFPEGLVLRTGEGEPLLALNGVQTLSAAICNLVRVLPAIAGMNVEVVRIAPNRDDIAAVSGIFRRAIDLPAHNEAIAAELDALVPAPACNGYWHGNAGMEATRAAAVRS